MVTAVGRRKRIGKAEKTCRLRHKAEADFRVTELEPISVPL